MTWGELGGKGASELIGHTIKTATEWVAMQYEVRSYRGGSKGLPDVAFSEICDAIDAIEIKAVETEQVSLQLQERERAIAEGKNAQKVGIQRVLNKVLRDRLTRLPSPWTPQVRLFSEDEESGKGLWTMDFRKTFGADERIGVEVTFNHAEALGWTLLRSSLAHQAEAVVDSAIIDVSVIIIGKDSVKRSRVPKVVNGQPQYYKNGNPKMATKYRMDGAVGTYERLMTFLPKVRTFVTVPMVIIGIDWADGTGDRTTRNMELTSSKAQL